MSDLTTRTYGLCLEERQGDEDGTLRASGYAAVFESYSQDMGFVEVIARGAFDNTDFSDVVFVLNHDISKLLSRTSNGTLRLSLDERGLRFDAEMAPVSYAQDVMTLLRGKYLDKASFKFRVEEDDWARAGGKDIRTIRSISVVRDVSVVTHPAYLATSTEARDAAAYLDFKKKQEEAERLFDVNMAAADLLMMKNKLSLSKPHGTWLK